MPPASFPRTAPGRHAASRCPARPVRRSASSAGTTTRCSSPTSTSSSPRSPKASPRDRTTSSSTRCATASCVRCSDDDPPPLLGVVEVCRHADAGAILLDTREPDEYAPVTCAARSTSVCRDASPRAPARSFRPTATSSWSVIPSSRRNPRSASLEWVSTGSSVNYETCQVFSRNGRISSRPLRALRPSSWPNCSSREPGLQLVDVRNPGETEDGVIPGRAGDSAADAHRFARQPRPDGAGRHLLRQRLPITGRRQPAASCGLRERRGPAGRVRCLAGGSRLTRA